jgi:ATP-dependent helicase HrpA
MPAGCRRLVRLALPSPSRGVERSLSARARLVLASNPDGSLGALMDDCADAAADTLMDEPPWSRTEFDALAARIRAVLPAVTAEIVAEVERVLAAAHEVRRALPDRPPPAQLEAVEDIRDQLRGLLPTGFVAATGRRRLADLVRYLTAIGRRLETLPRDPATDHARMARVRVVQQAYDDLRRALPRVRADAADLADIRWQIEELRVSLWAQQLGTPRPVSEQRIFRALDAVVA